MHITSSLKREEGTRVLSAERFLISVGTHPVAPPGTMPDNETVILSDGILDLTRLPQTLTVVGAGVIGIEYASMFAELGI